MSIIFWRTLSSCAGMLPRVPKVRIWGANGNEGGLDDTKRFLHVTDDALVLEIEGEEDVRSRDTVADVIGVPAVCAWMPPGVHSIHRSRILIGEGSRAWDGGVV